MSALMALITINAVVDVSLHIFVMETGRIVAAVASGALEDRIVIGVGVARRAHTVSAAVSGRELRVLRMVERGSGPGRRGVASRARSREELRLRRMAWVGRVVVVGLMATDASGRQRRVVAVDVAECASRRGVRAGQRERRVVVIERGICPDRRVVAQLASRWESGGGVGRTRRAGIVLLVARVTQSAVQGVVVVDVAIGAEPRRHRVRASQREPGRGVIEHRVGPQVRVVAGITRGWEACRYVIHWCGRVVVIVQVARDASRHRDVVVVVDVAVGAQARRHHVIAS